MPKPDTIYSPLNVFGRTFENALHAPVLIIGRDKWDRLDLAAMGISQLRAARAVSQLAAEMKAKSTADMFERLGADSLAATYGIGLHCLFVLWRAFEAQGLDPADWYWRGREGTIRTFLALKGRAHRRAAEEKAAEKRSRRRSGTTTTARRASPSVTQGVAH